MKYPRCILTTALIAGLASSFALHAALGANAPPVSLAVTYTNQSDLSLYRVSEKLDGARAWWNGKNLISRNGNIFHAPNWFIHQFPQQILDGELWMGRESFQTLMQTIRDTEPDHEAWKKVRFMVFDAPEAGGTFDQRQVHLASMAAEIRSPYLQLVPQIKIPNRQRLNQYLLQVVDNGGEGLILQRGDQHYRAGRHSGLLKLKTHQDDEAYVIAHLPGKGKYKGMTGSLLVVDKNGLKFRLGSGLTDAERLTPPEVGSKVSYRFQGRTRSGKPRFARYLRVRPAE